MVGQKECLFLSNQQSQYVFNGNLAYLNAFL